MKEADSVGGCLLSSKHVRYTHGATWLLFKTAKSTEKFQLFPEKRLPSTSLIREMFSYLWELGCRREQTLDSHLRSRMKKRKYFICLEHLQNRSWMWVWWGGWSVAVVDTHVRFPGVSKLRHFNQGQSGPPGLELPVQALGPWLVPKFMDFAYTFNEYLLRTYEEPNIVQDAKTQRWEENQTQVSALGEFTFI